MLLHLLSHVLLLGSLSLAEAANSDGCSKEFEFPAQPGGPSKGIQIGERRVRITLPKNYDQKVPTPLILAYHDKNMTASDMEQTSRLSDPKQNPDAIVVYPEAVDNKWLSDEEANIKVDDKAFTTSLVDGLAERLCLDNSRIYATGLGSGAGFVHLMACDPHFSNKTAAFALVNPAILLGLMDKRHIKDEITLLWEKCKPARVPMKLLEIHGENNTINHYWAKVKTKRARSPVVQWLVEWALRNECGQAKGVPTKDSPEEVMYKTQLESGTIYEGIVHPNKLQRAAYRCYGRTNEERVQQYLEGFKLFDPRELDEAIKGKPEDRDAIREGKHKEKGSDAVKADEMKERAEKMSEVYTPDDSERGEIGLEHFFIKNYGHGWPRLLLKDGTTQQVESEELVATNDTPIFDATAEVLRWFNEHKLSEVYRAPDPSKGPGSKPQLQEDELSGLLEALGAQIEKTKDAQTEQEEATEKLAESLGEERTEQERLKDEL